jgi:hypothetical protein
MVTPLSHSCPDIDEGQFVTEADWIPGFWNFLLDLDRDDLIDELRRPPEGLVLDGREDGGRFWRAGENATITV